MAAALALALFASGQALGSAATITGVADLDFYRWDSLRLIAGSDELRLHSLGTDPWEVWACDVPTGAVELDPAAIAARLEAELGPYFEWLSEGRYRPIFRAAGWVEAATTPACTAAAAAASAGTAAGAIIVADVPYDGGFGNPGVWCPLETGCSTPTTFPANFRSVLLDAYTVTGPDPRIRAVAHELGHTLHWPHSFSGRTTGTWAEYDNPIDLMGSRYGLLATPAVNRYAAGWVSAGEVVVAAGAASVELTPVGGGGSQLLVLPSGEEGHFAAVDVRVRTGYDAGLAAEGVTLHVVDQRPQTCGGVLPCLSLSRRVRPEPAVAGGTAHVLVPGDAVEVGRWRIEVLDRRGDTYTVAVGDGGSAPPPPVRSTPPAGSDLVGAHDPATGRWALQLADGSHRSFYFGIPGDLPMACDWDGDGVDSPGLYRALDGFLYLRNSNTTGVADVAMYYGIPGDIPVCGDWDGDGVDTPGVYRPAEQRFYLRNSNTQGVADVELVYGDPGDLPFAGDWDGDGVDEPAVVRRSDATAYPVGSAPWTVGVASDRMVAGDWLGTGTDLLAGFGSDLTITTPPSATGSGAVIGSVQVVPVTVPGANPVAGRWG